MKALLGGLVLAGMVGCSGSSEPVETQGQGLVAEGGPFCPVYHVAFAPNVEVYYRKSILHSFAVWRSIARAREEFVEVEEVPTSEEFVKCQVSVWSVPTPFENRDAYTNYHWYDETGRLHGANIWLRSGGPQEHAVDHVTFHETGHVMGLKGHADGDNIMSDDMEFGNSFIVTYWQVEILRYLWDDEFRQAARSMPLR